MTKSWINSAGSIYKNTWHSKPLVTTNHTGHQLQTWATSEIYIKFFYLKFRTEFTILTGVTDFKWGWLDMCLHSCVYVQDFCDKEGQQCLTSMTAAVLVALSCLLREIHLSPAVCVSQISADLTHTCTRFPCHRHGGELYVAWQWTNCGNKP